MRQDVVVCSTPDALASRAADEFESACRLAVAARGSFAVALSGGSTPRAMFAKLASRAVDWQLVHFFWSDERCVPPTDPNSNYGAARAALLSKIAVVDANVHRMRGELEPQAGAADYVARLRSFFGGEPLFDLIFLGLGPDGHTASLFPGTTALDARDPCVANRVTSGVASPWRLTLTYPVINAAREVVFVVEGSEKAQILQDVLDGPRDPRRLPAQGVGPASGDLRWLVDSAAASRL